MHPYGLANRRITTAHAIGPLERLRSGDSEENGSDAFEPGNETHMIVPFIIE